MKNEIQRVALRDLVHRNLLNRILRGELPAGSRVKDTDLSQDLDVSRTPVREALVRLVKEGHLENQVGKGFVVRHLTHQEVREIYPIIWSLEGLALKTSQPPKPDRIPIFNEIAQDMEKPQADFVYLIELDNKWHTTLLSGCKNSRLLDMIADLKAIAFRYEYAYMQDHNLVESSVREHNEIVRILYQEGLTAAASRLERHWIISMHALLEKILKPE